MYNEVLFSKIAMILLFVGAIDLGIYGLTGVHLLLLMGMFIGRVICLLIGIAAGFLIYLKYIKKTTPVV